MSNHSPAASAGLFVALGLIASAAIFGVMLKDMRKADRSVTVKGLVEREVVANMALWPLSLSVAGDDLNATQTQLETSIGTVKSFLIEKGFKDEEIAIAPVRVLDRKAVEYGEFRAGQARYVIQDTVNLRSENVDLVQKVSRMTNELVRSGVTLSQTQGTCNTGPMFLFTRLNEIKPEMLAEATKNARAAAQQFATDSGSNVGQIKRASQGTFSISERDSVEAGGIESGYSCSSDPNKRIRVVTTVDYYLE